MPNVFIKTCSLALGTVHIVKACLGTIELSFTLGHQEEKLKKNFSMESTCFGSSLVQ